ncbi:MAG: hypothetical protein ACYC06_11595, partial [Ilumatobacteraceae bacterium]
NNVIVPVITKSDELETMISPVIVESFAGTPGQYHDVVNLDSVAIIGTATGLFANSVDAWVDDASLRDTSYAISEPTMPTTRITAKKRRIFIITPALADSH